MHAAASPRFDRMRQAIIHQLTRAAGRVLQKKHAPG
jgi:hypothetical protein